MQTAQDTNRLDRKVRVIHMETRWAIEQTGQTTFDLIVPLGGGIPLINPVAAAEMELKPGEVQSAEDAAIKAIAVKS